MTDITDAAIKQLPRKWQGPAYAAFIGGVLVAGYFLFLQGPVAQAQKATVDNSRRIDDASHRIDNVETDIRAIKGDVADIKSSSAARDQKMDDIKDSMDQLGQKLDRLLEQQRK